MVTLCLEHPAWPDRPEAKFHHLAYLAFAAYGRDGRHFHKIRLSRGCERHSGGGVCTVPFQSADFASLPAAPFGGLHAITDLKVMAVALMLGGVMKDSWKTRVIAICSLSSTKTSGLVFMSIMLTAVGVNLV